MTDLDLDPFHQFRGYINPSMPGIGGRFGALEFWLTNHGSVGHEIHQILGGFLESPPNCMASEADFVGPITSTGDFIVTEIGLSPGATPITLPATIGPNEVWHIRMDYPALRTRDGRLHVDDMSGQTMANTGFELRFF